ncbi:MAG TPA: MFS transporter [Kofleriaceae bacterium]|nr:MFS transporter [Kofleriaceae bacterium]
MSWIKSGGRYVACFLILELLVGAWIWFGDGAPARAQPPPPPAPTAHQAAPTAAPTATPAPAPAAPGAAACPKKKPSPSRDITGDLVPIGILIVVIAVVVWRLPRVELGHSPAFLRRRLLNWLPLGLSYSFLYFGRYNIKQFQGIGLTEGEYGAVFGVGSAVYGLAFLLNGPLTDRWGGRATMLIATAGSAAANLWMGYMAATGDTLGMSAVTAFSLAFAINMYFQSFGAVSIVKVNAAWFHLRERGTFGGIFGILISLGLYFAYDVGKRITEHFAVEWLFYIPALLLVIFFGLTFVFVRNQPSDTGHPDFDLGDASRDDGARLTAIAVFKKLLTHPIILTISIIELCSGFLRQAILQWGVDFGKGAGLGKTFVFENWGMVSCVAGITGGMFAGAISDHLFQSRRSPVSAVLYLIMLAGAIAIVPLLTHGTAAIGWVVALMSMAIIGVHGMLTATASADFAGKKNTGMAVGIIDGFVYLGSTAQSFLYGAYLPPAKVRDAGGCLVNNPEAAKIENWTIWPYAMIPVALFGLVLATRIWNARPTRGGGGH